MPTCIESSPGKQGETKEVPRFELTAFRNHEGQLSKKVTLDGDKLKKSPAATLTRGRAKRLTCSTMADLAGIIEQMLPSEALALGVLIDDLPDHVSVVTEVALAKHPERPANLIARTKKFLRYRENAPALVLLDFDTGGMPDNVKQRIDERGFFGALCDVMPELRGVAHVTRASTSAGIFNEETGEHYGKSSGMHVYVLISDGTDAERFLKTLQQRCALHGLAWHVVTKNGSLLQRSVIDSSVHGPERLVFEGPPELMAPLEQDATTRQPVAVEGGVLDTRDTCPDLTPEEMAKAKAFWSAEANRIAPEAYRQAEIYATEIAGQRDVPLEQARQIVAAQGRGQLLPDDVLHFVDSKLGTVRVAEVLKNPAPYIGKSLRDPGGADGDRAKLYRRDKDGTLCVHSFHRGEQVYELKPPAPEPGTAEAPKSPAIWFSDSTWSESSIPPRPWIVPGHLLRGAVTMLAGPPSAMKSLLSLTWGVALALNQKHGRFMPAQESKVLIFNVEDSDDEQRRRLSAILNHFGSLPDDLRGKLYRAGPIGIGTLFCAGEKKGAIEATDAYAQLVEAIEAIRPDVLIVDPFSELHTFDENANTEIRLVIAQLRKLAERYQMAVCVLHHTRKGSANSAGDTDTARGASSIIGACRIVLTLMPMSEKDAADFGMPKDSKTRIQYARLDDAKSNYSAIREPCWYTKEFTTLANGEGAIVPKSWFPPVQRAINDDSIKEIIDGVKRGIQTEKGVQPYSPKRDDKEERSIRKLLTMHGFTPGQEASLMRALEELGMETLDFTTPARNVRKGLRMGGLPVASWSKSHEQLEF